MVHTLSELIDLATVIVPMTTASNQKVDNIQMKAGDDSSFEPRVHPPLNTSQADKEEYKEQFKQMNLFMKGTGKNDGGIPDNKKPEWAAINKDLLEIINNATYNSSFYHMLDTFVMKLKLEPKSMIGIGFEGDNNDCTWTKGLLKAFNYLTEKDFDVHVFAVKAMPGKSLLNPKFFSSWRDAVNPSLFKKWHFLIVGDDFVLETKMLKETWTNNVAHIIVNFLSIHFHWNAAGNKFNAGARLMLEQVGVMATTDATMEKIYTDWDTDKTDNMQTFFSHMADTNNVKLETSLDGLFNAVYRN